MFSEKSKIVVFGAGAVGCFFGGRLARAGRKVTLIARPDHVKAIRQYGLQMDCQDFQGAVTVDATEGVGPIADADLVLLTVKSPETENAARMIKPVLRHDACILSLQNGVDNCERIEQQLNQPAYSAVVYVAAAMVGPGRLKHFGRGELVVGYSGPRASGLAQRKLSEISKIFSDAGMPCKVSADIRRDLWSKFLVNCTYNGISAIGQTPYGEMVKVPQIWTLIEQLTREFLQVAEAEGIALGWEEAMDANRSIAQTMSGQRSSTAQDLARSKPTEIDHLNGLIVRKGLQYGIPTPTHQAVYSLVKMLER